MVSDGGPIIPERIVNRGGPSGLQSLRGEPLVLDNPVITVLRIDEDVKHGSDREDRGSVGRVTKIGNPVSRVSPQIIVAQEAGDTRELRIELSNQGGESGGGLLCRP